MTENSSVPKKKDGALLNSYKTQLRDNVQIILLNFEELLRMVFARTLGQIADGTQQEMHALEMQVRSGNLLRAGEALLKLVNDIKEYCIIYDFSSIEEEMNRQSKLLCAKQVEYDAIISEIVKDLADELTELEEEYYENSCGYY
ncbi:mediator of RNA polymerase II transcription subunit 22 [Drosophila santomea]|uniref:mediator of RNA polymerase II transcription subunit 22 n=1 Tax=Drosophila santomea TaxID=129105 RepID=UPI001CCE2072|nr:mediator of RNA polymerase II transcription subunit 22 [Drosophila santomea]XP_039480043.2 mediator of RNA polymerase II transcription subunit 22 [Drosophila santomea]XP_039480132.2 mediator of RNA polymerase II transcription subunit 22 [Drosophila santomea]